ncbi:pyrroline-5-carboxylate reductase [Oceaniovalibus guishaninsula JLT2003]|uniref:Pyrroline-5-carboxylate reductase n=1 Tax=Oceaniovalibus guishaninsula JLT2003 TaxID=1231392 RepID=K2H9L2_9RHOB|nr:pyrroline-5-carboxylate reductase [Oceaniovalibus guishaninsula]EKE44233.1 pyrroline-5-carboxylate reductase [Oceaniovalibus guishaninsula JLT2003]
MDMETLRARGLVLLGCGRMGGALLRGWLAGGFPPGAVHVIDPDPADWLTGTGVHLNEPLPDAPGIVLVAVKPQMMTDALPSIRALGGGATVFLSVAAGTPIAAFEAALGQGTPVIRAMPNTPAAIGRGITALVANSEGVPSLDLADELMGAVGQVVRLDDEAQMDAVTAVSGSGPAYVFHLIECLAAAGEAQGLAPDLALRLARATVGGAGHLAEDAGESPGDLRRAVTSPNGTTQAALEVLMAEDGLAPLMRRAVAAAADRSRELRG